MDQYKFVDSDSKVIVNAIVEGYREYIEHRREQMIISSAFAWTKGNFIEDKVAKNGSKLNIKYEKAKAGLTWDYLQFNHQDTKKLFLIKNAAYFNAGSFSQATLPNKNSSRTRTYLHELSEINQNLEFPDGGGEVRPFEGSEQLRLFIPENRVKRTIEQTKSSFNEFHILTYEIDEAYQISTVMHYLPNPADNIAYLVDDLSRHISGAELSDEEREIIAPDYDRDILDPSAFDIVIIDEDEEKEN